MRMLENNIDLDFLESELIEWGIWQPDCLHMPSVKPNIIGRLMGKSSGRVPNITEDRALEIDSAVSKVKKIGLEKEWICGVAKFRYHYNYGEIAKRQKINRNKVSGVIDTFVKVVHVNLSTYNDQVMTVDIASME